MEILHVRVLQSLLCCKSVFWVECEEVLQKIKRFWVDVAEESVK